MLRKRKRKISGEAAAAPRATRQRRVVDDEEERGSTVPERTSGSPGSPRAPKTPKTPGTGRRTTRKKSVVAASQDLTMSTRSRKAMKLKNPNDSDVENEVDQSRQRSKRAASKRSVAESVGSDETHATRSRAKKGAKDAAQDSSEPRSDAENTGKSSLPKGKRRTRKKRVLTSADNTIVESPKAVKTPVKSTARSQPTQLVATKAKPVTDSTESQETAFLQLKPNRISIVERIQDTPRKISPRKHSSSLIQSSVDTVTPESSPLLVNLTPHRSSKTPKKSPVNIGSPKTHSQSPLRLSKTPRKLTVESPATSDKSSVSMATQSPVDPRMLVCNNQGNSHIMLTDCMKGDSLKTQQDSNSPKNLSSSLLTVDEIWEQVVANSPNARSSRRFGSPASKVRRSPVKTPASVKKLEALGTPLINRVSTPLRTPVNARLSILVNPDSPKRLRSTTKKNSPVTPLRPISVAEESQGNVSSAAVGIKMNLLDVSNASSADQTRRSLRLTPDFMKFSADSTSSPIPTPKKTGRVLPQVFRRSEGSEDQSLELLDCNDFVDVSGDALGNCGVPNEIDRTFEVIKDDDVADKIDQEILEETEEHNATYELAEPKTPNLRRKSRKRSLSNVETSHCTPEAKKRCRVRFASPNQEDRVKTSSVMPGSAKKSLPTSNTPGKQRLGARLSAASSRPGSSKRRSRSLTKIEDKNSSTRAGAKRRSNSVSAFSGRTPKLSQNIQSSVNRLSRPRQTVNSEAKSETKVSVPRKIPNFAQIHQKKFEKMESLVDAKKRVAKRHEELNTLPPTRASPRSSSATAATVPKKPIPAPSGSKNSEFTRFGFKLRKVDAVKMMSKKAPAVARTKNHVVSNRSVLKDVRTNKRFELQMKFRKITDDKR